MNNVSLTGRLTRDCDLKFTEGSGTASCKFSLAVDRDYKTKDGRREADFINCICFNKMAEGLSPYLIKGIMIGVVGRIQTASYVNKDDKKVFTTDVIVEKVQFLEKRNATVETTVAAPVEEYKQATFEEGDIPF